MHTHWISKVKKIWLCGSTKGQPEDCFNHFKSHEESSRITYGLIKVEAANSFLQNISMNQTGFWQVSSFHVLLAYKMTHYCLQLNIALWCCVITSAISNIFNDDSECQLFSYCFKEQSYRYFTLKRRTSIIHLYQRCLQLPQYQVAQPVR